MKKIFLLAFILLFSMQISLACEDEIDAGHGNEITGSSILGVSGFEIGYLLPIIILIIGLGYVIYKINKIEDKIKNKK